MPTTKKPSGEAPKKKLGQPEAPVTDPIAEKPARRARKTEEAPATPTPPEAVSPKRSWDRTLVAVVAFIAGVALFAVGFGIGRASGNDRVRAVGMPDRQQSLPHGAPFADRGRPGFPMPGGPSHRGHFFPGPGGAPGPDYGDDEAAVPDVVNGAFLGITGVDAPLGGVRVIEVHEGSGAAAAGLLAGDRIVSIDAEPVLGMRQLSDVIGSSRPGDSIAIEVVRGGQNLTLTATLSARVG